MINLFGKIIHTIYSDNQSYILFRGYNDLLYTAEADCCSHTWIENIENPDTLIESEIIGIERKDMPDLENPTENDCVQCYGWSLRTSKGVCDIEFRNASNGYYGGSLDLYGLPFKVTKNEDGTVTVLNTVLKQIA